MKIKISMILSCSKSKKSSLKPTRAAPKQNSISIGSKVAPVEAKSQEVEDPTETPKQDLQNNHHKITFSKVCMVITIVISILGLLQPLFVS